MSHASLKDADVILCLNVDIPWMAGFKPAAGQRLDRDHGRSSRRSAAVPTMEFTADLRLTADAMLTIEALEAEARRLITPEDAAGGSRRVPRNAPKARANAVAIWRTTPSPAQARGPIDPKWLSHTIGQRRGRQLHRVRRNHRAKSGARLPRTPRGPAPTSTIRVERRRVARCGFRRQARRARART